MSKHVEVEWTLSYVREGVTIIERDCTVHVEVDTRDDDYIITGFTFEETPWLGGKPLAMISTHFDKSDALFPFLKDCIQVNDRDTFPERLWDEVRDTEGVVKERLRG